MNNWGMAHIAIADTNCIYTSGQNNSLGKLYKSTNLGITWDSMLTTTDYYSYLHFFNKDTGLISGGDSFDNFIWRTTNGGQSLQLIATYGGASPGKFHFLKEKVNGEYYGWYYKTGGINYRTTNSGLNWTEMPLIPTFYSVNYLYYLNKDTGWVTIGSNQQNIFTTTNGGINWISKNLPGIYTKYDIYFANSRKGWISTAYNFIYATSDGGFNWGTQSLPIPGSGKIFFLDSMIAWNGDGNYLSHTTNGGGNIVRINNYENSISKNFTLSQNYPNPFNSYTKIKYIVKYYSFVAIKIFDLLGNEIEIIKNSGNNPGEYEFIWNASKYSSGIYFYKMYVSDIRNTLVYTETKKMIYLK
jgi:photosystem II stability/assembly factor-like uncharacterized protein